jgi:thymidylate synthase
VEVYQELIEHVLTRGEKKLNRTGVETLSCFAYFYRIDLAKGYPLLTTKKMNFSSMLWELFWYLSGEPHIRGLRERTKIWNAWADPEGNLQTAYGRFWRRFPCPESGYPGESWTRRWTSRDAQTGELVFDQIACLLDSLRELKTNPQSPRLRRLVLSAWHPGNAAESLLPPCHYSFCLNAASGRLNLHLTQRSADIALGVPFNIACYSLLTILFAREAGLEPGEFAHTLIDAHIYANHIEGLKEQLNRRPLELPRLVVADKGFDELGFEDISLKDYRSHPAISFPVAV